MARKPLPGPPPAGDSPDPAVRAAALPAVCMDDDRPHPCKQEARMIGVHGNLEAAGVLVGEERVFPGLPAIFGAEDAPLLLGAVAVPERSHEHDIGIAGVDGHPANPARLLEAHMLPGLAGIGGFIDAVADRDIAADEGLTRPRPDDVGV